MEGGIYNFRRIIQANSDILWINEHTNNISDHDEQILQNLINTGKIASFIDDIIIRTKKEEEHDEIVEKVVRRLTENNLYVKLEKYK